MRVTKEKAQANRLALVAAAAKLFREHGFDAVSVAQIALAAGLTHGAFYSHFESKEEIAAAACGRAIGESAEYWRDVAARHPRAPFKAIARGYLAVGHRDMAGPRCTFAALGSDLARGGDVVRRAVTQALPEQIAVLEQLMPGRTRASRRKQALAAYSGLIGALIMARAVDDENLSDEFLEAALAQAIAA